MNILHFLSGSLISFFFYISDMRFKIVNNPVFLRLGDFFPVPGFLDIHLFYEVISMLLNYNSIMQEILMQTLSRILVLTDAAAHSGT